MKKYSKYIAGGFGFFMTFTLLDYIFKINVDWKVNIAATIIYLVSTILCDYFLLKKEK